MDVWVVIHEEDLLAMLSRVAEGEDPGIVLAEHYANADHQNYGPGGEQ